MPDSLPAFPTYIYPAHDSFTQNIPFGYIFRLSSYVWFFAWFRMQAPLRRIHRRMNRWQIYLPKKLRLEEGVQGRPLPTNDWWTTLLSEKDFPGRLYAYPFTISANAEGVQIWYPLEWNENGRK